MEKVRIGISIGDFNGIGLEIILKTLANQQLLNFCTPVIYGTSKVVSYHKNIVGIEEFPYNTAKSADRIRHDRVNIVNCWQDNVNITLGQLSDVSGKYAYISLEQATNDLKNGFIDALVTAPIHKKAMQLANFPYAGHTEYLTNAFGGSSLMLMVNDNLRVGLVTNHLPISEVAAAITKELIVKKLKLLNKTLKEDFAIERPTIAVLGLNPHAGDDGVIGEEEEHLIRPVIIEAKKKGILAFGPYPADGLFGSAQYQKFDGILAMYHDQGLAPFKAISFGSGVNFTAGLSAIRTSPDHGTAYDIAGKNQADPSSFRNALFVAVDIVKNRAAYKEMHANPLSQKAKMVKEGQEDEALPPEEEHSAL